MWDLSNPVQIQSESSYTEYDIDIQRNVHKKCNSNK